MVNVREAQESDVEAVRELFLAAYGEHYAYPAYYDIKTLKKLVYTDSSILLVAEEDDQLLGTASVVMHVGAYNDLVGEFGRLVVHPDARGKGVGHALMQGRIERVQERLHVGLVENRTVHPFSQKISAKNHFACVGFLPAKLLTDRRESVALYARYFGDALKLRRNHPRIISEAAPLAERAMRNLSLDPDQIVDVGCAAYVNGDTFQLEQFSTTGYSTLLRLERGRVHDREIVGPLQLHYGLFQLRARYSTYLVARDGERLAGAIGFAHDPAEKAVRVFELISASERPIRFLLEQLSLVCTEREDVEFVEIDVNAHAPRMQRTLLELGYLPCAYVPALTFHHVERLDVIKMVRVFESPDFSDVCLAPTSEALANSVMEQFTRRAPDPLVIAAARRGRLFAGLNDEQSQILAAEMALESHQAGAIVLAAGEPADRLCLIVSGEVEINTSDGEQQIAVLAAGQCVGERSLMSESRHAHTSQAKGDLQLAVLYGDALERLVRRRPDIGLVLYRNLANELASKLG
jgi:GNAT superfamily N-acetyltransferase